VGPLPCLFHERNVYTTCTVGQMPPRSFELTVFALDSWFVHVW